MHLSVKEAVARPTQVRILTRAPMYSAKVCFKQTAFMRFFEADVRPLCFPEALSIREKLHVPTTVENLSARINAGRFMETGDLPKIDEEQVVSIAIEQMLKPFKTASDHKFGSQWNKLTAISAARTLRMPTTHLERKLAVNTPLSWRLKTRQAEIAQAWEQNCQIKTGEHIEKLKPEVAKTIWVQQRLEMCNTILNSFPVIPKTQKEKFKTQATGALIDFIHKFGEQTFDRTDFLRRGLLSMVNGTPLDLISLHCPPFRHTQEGINVIPNADDQVLIRADGKRIVVSQWDTIEGVVETAKLLEQNGLRIRITTAVVDIDEFVVGDQEKTLVSFCHCLLQKIHERGLPTEVVRVSRLIGIPSLDANHKDVWQAWKTWQERCQTTNTLAMNLINEEFERLQKTSLPAKMKTREFATLMASKRFVVHFLMGKSLSILFPEGIVLLRARGNEASLVDKLGAKSINAKLFIINHWQERKILDDD